MGAGTFKPLSDGDVHNIEMHGEEIILSTSWLKRYLNHKGPRFAVGTTSLRTLESCHWIGVNYLENGIVQDLGQFDAYELIQNTPLQMRLRDYLVIWKRMQFQTWFAN